jgi:hypothetical protein
VLLLVVVRLVGRVLVLPLLLMWQLRLLGQMHLVEALTKQQHADSSYSSRCSSSSSNSLCSSHHSSNSSR